MKISIKAFGAGASGSSGKYDDELGGWPVIVKIDDLVVAAFCNGRWDSEKNTGCEREAFARTFAFEYVDRLIRNSPEGTEVELDDQESWLNGVEWPEGDERADFPSVTITREEWMAFNDEGSR